MGSASVMAWLSDRCNEASFLETASSGTCIER
jgi:hypothetical protein